MAVDSLIYKDFYHVEAQDFAVEQENPSIFVVLLKATGIFFLITFIVFGITNYQFIQAQIADWRAGGDYNDFNADADLDGLPDWWEKKYGLSLKENNADEDNDNDEANNLLEYQFDTNPFVADTDEDGYSDGREIKNGYNPNGEGRLDTDGDGLYDWWEIKNSLDKNDPSDADIDSDGDGLNNKDEFIYNTNPLEADTDKDGVSDGDEVAKKRNPTGKGPLLIHDKTMDDADGDGLDLFHENLFGSDPNNPDTDGDGFSDYREISRGYDPTGGLYMDTRIKIPAIGVDAPIIWVHDTKEKEILNKLEKGVIHYPGTPIPSMRGNSYITGHSSYYSWSKSKFKEVLKGINKLKVGDEIIFTFKLASGKSTDIIYRVTKAGIVVLPDDERLFEDYEGRELTLVTCWPIGTNLKRMMVKAELTRPKLK
jgi:LPXTG-site transpeptidase (sortase) family protein